MRWLLLLLVAACTPAQVAAPAPAARQRWLAVLVAGDGSLPVFDNATGRLAALLAAAGTPAAAIHRLSDAPEVLARPGVQRATRRRVLETVAGLRPGPGEACLVFVTSHGAEGKGVYLAAGQQFLTPAALDGALQAGCGGAPTVVVASACYSGGFARPPVASAGRVVLTAARADRPSFGCEVGRELAFYDQCLLEALSPPPTDWAMVGACVARLEQADGERPSEPQVAVGAGVAGLAVVGR